MRESIQNQHKNTWACTTSLGVLQFVSHRTEKNSIISHPPSQTITNFMRQEPQLALRNFNPCSTM